jgi:Flp pilus assembly pilin Flp
MSYLAKARARLHGSTLIRDEAGLSTVEYVVVLVLVCAVAIGVWKVFGETVRGGLSKASDKFNSDVVGADLDQTGAAPPGGAPRR